MVIKRGYHSSRRPNNGRMTESVPERMRRDAYAFLNFQSYKHLFKGARSSADHMSRASQASSSSARLNLANSGSMGHGGPSTSTSASTLGVRQRIDVSAPQSMLLTPTNAIKKRPSSEIPRLSVKGKEREGDQGKELKHGRRWQQGWVKEGFRQFGEHCARNQVSSRCH